MIYLIFSKRAYINSEQMYNLLNRGTGFSEMIDINSLWLRYSYIEGEGIGKNDRYKQLSKLL